MIFHPVFSEFLSTFVSHRVRFLVVGGHALAVHGRPRYTDDLDVWVEPTPANAKRVIEALQAFGYEAYSLSAAEFATPDRMTHLGKPPMRIDIMTSVTGVRFRDAWANRMRAKIEGMTLCFLGRKQLIQNKAAAGRAKDLADLALLEEAEQAPRKRRRPSRRKG
ncbi:MAG: nucleotidyltransferase [Polyangiales bacterium]